MQGFQTHTAVQPISIQLLQTQQKPRVTEAQHNAEKYYRSGTVNSNTVNSKFHLIRSFFEIFARFLSFHV